MTTIACDGKRMSCDGQVSCGQSILSTDVVKIFRIQDGSIVGFAGNTYNWEPLLEYFNSTSKTKKWPTLDGNQDTMLLRPDGTILLYDHLGRSNEHEAPVAIGSGWRWAMGAMDAGASVKKAIEIAIKRDVWTSGTITTLKLNDK